MVLFPISQASDNKRNRLFEEDDQREHSMKPEGLSQTGNHPAVMTPGRLFWTSSLWIAEGGQNRETKPQSLEKGDILYLFLITSPSS